VKGFVKRRNESTMVTAFRHVVTVTKHNTQIQSSQIDFRFTILLQLLIKTVQSTFKK